MKFKELWDWFFNHPFTVIFTYLIILLIFNIGFYVYNFDSFCNKTTPPVRVVNIPSDKCVEVYERPFQILIKPCETNEKKEPLKPSSM